MDLTPKTPKDLPGGELAGGFVCAVAVEFAREIIPNANITFRSDFMAGPPGSRFRGVARTTRVARGYSSGLSSFNYLTRRKDVLVTAGVMKRMEWSNCDLSLFLVVPPALGAKDTPTAIFVKFAKYLCRAQPRDDARDARNAHAFAPLRDIATARRVREQKAGASSRTPQNRGNA